MEEWISENLSKILDFTIPPDLTKFIMQIQDERDLDDYLKTLLNYNDVRHKQFITNLKKQRGSYFNALAGTKKSNGQQTTSQKQTEKKKGKMSKPTKEVTVETKSEPEKTEKKKTKFVNLYSEDGKTQEILLKGRHKCDCEAKQHKLINNCTNCGRIVCLQEGAGPCFFCGGLVCSPQQQQVLMSNSKQADSLYNKLMDQKPSKHLDEQLKRRDQLLEFDRNCEQRTKVIDDESDYFQASTNTWLSKEEREKLQKKADEMMERKHGSRLKQKMTFDFAGRQIVHENQEELMCLDDEGRVQKVPTNSEFIFPESELMHLPTYIPLGSSDDNVRKTHHRKEGKNRIQDKEYLEMSDDGICLSMHQPYASLLVAGIKEHEGRTWYTAHRGRLWIASAAKVPTPDEISHTNNFYRLLKGEDVQFPKHYPTSCLLGCVTVTQVLPQEEYRKKFPEGESTSPYVFICEDFHQLPIRFPIQGKHKLYKLDDKIHRAAMNSLEKLTQNKD